jgi:mRNA interferase MazF
LKQYELWWADLPPPVGRRPVLLLSRNLAYARLSRVLVAQVTTTIRGIPVEVLVGRTEGLRTKSAVNLDNLETVAVARLADRIGALSPTGVRDVKRALGHALEWPELTAI